MAKRRAAPAPQHFPFSRIAIILVLFAIFYGIVPQLPFFRGTFVVINHGQLMLVILAAIAFAGTYFAAAAVYLSLSSLRLRFIHTVLVQVAGTFANRILPAGSGAVSVNYEYFRRCNYDAPGAVSLIAVNNTVGVIGNGILLAAAYLLARHKVAVIFDHVRIPAPYVVLLGVLLLIGAGFIAWIWQYRLTQFMRSLFSDLMNYGHRPGRLIMALTASMTLTFLSAVTLFLCSRATGATISIALSLAIGSVGVLVGALTPAPGGIGGVEAALLYGLIRSGVSNGAALAAVLSYRLITFWLALAVGAVAFMLTLRLRLLTPHQ